ncbi:MAG: hypothetical protein KC503_01395 [Myxococcales bacterium]|nr:hypothetical protein [Myxococcales bacterium]
MFHLTKLDEELAASGGSRDPLGLQPVWSYFGRKLVPSLTTVSTRSQHFSRLLLALSCRDTWLAQRPGTELSGVEALLVFEELHAYSLRAEMDDIGETPGKRRVEVNWRELRGDPEIGHWPEQQILRNQAGVGISGRYFTPLVRMGIVDKEGCLAGDVRVEQLFGVEVNRLQRAVRTVLEAIEESQRPVAFSSVPKTARRLMARLLPHEGHVADAEVSFWKQRIGIDGERAPLVRRAAAYLRQTPKDVEQVPRAVVNALLDSELSATLRGIVADICACEAYIAPLQKLFDQLYLAGSLSRFDATEVTRAWRDQLRQAQPSFARLRVEGEQLGRRFRSLVEIEASGSSGALARSLLRHHTLVSEGRGGTPWLAIESSKVHALNSAYEPWAWSSMDEAAWVNGYYVPSLRSVLDGLDQRQAQ